MRVDGDSIACLSGMQRLAGAVIDLFVDDWYKASVTEWDRDRRRFLANDEAIYFWFMLAERIDLYEEMRKQYAQVTDIERWRRMHTKQRVKDDKDEEDDSPSRRYQLRSCRLRLNKWFRDRGGKGRVPMDSPALLNMVRSLGCPFLGLADASGMVIDWTVGKNEKYILMRNGIKWDRANLETKGLKTFELA